MVYHLKNDWQEITEQEGTFYAPSRAVELSDAQEAGTGLILPAGVAASFKRTGKLYARAASSHARLNVIGVSIGVV